MAKQVARGAGGRFGKAGDPGVVLRYELDATEYFATLSALDRETQAWINRTATSVNKVDKAFSNAATGGIARGGKAMHVFRNAAMLAGYEMAGMGGAVGKLAYLLTALQIPLTAVTASLGVIAGLGIAIWKVDAIAAWIEGVDEAAQRAKDLEEKLKMVRAETLRVNEAFKQTIERQGDLAYDIAHPSPSAEASLERQRFLVQREAGQSLSDPKLNEESRRNFQEQTHYVLRAIDERIRALRIESGEVDPGFDSEEMRGARADRFSEIGRQDDFQRYMRNFDALEARENRLAESRKARMDFANANRLSSSSDIRGGAFGSLEEALRGQRDRMMLQHNLPSIARDAGLSVNTVSQLLGFGGAQGRGGGFSTTGAQVHAIGAAGGLRPGSETSQNPELMTLKQIENVLKKIEGSVRNFRGLSP